MPEFIGLLTRLDRWGVQRKRILIARESEQVGAEALTARRSNCVKAKEMAA